MKNELTYHEKVLRQARIGLRHGWFVVPIPHGRKAPVIKGWPHLRLKEPDLPNAFGETDGIGVILGEPSRDLVDVDQDSDEAIAVGSVFLPATNRIHGRKSKPSSHWWYLVDPAPAPMQFTDVDGSMIVELRSD